MPVGVRVPDRIGPLAETALLSAVDLLTISDQSNEDASASYPRGGADKDLRLTVRKAVLALHLGSIPCSLGLVEDEKALVRRLAALAIGEDRLVQILDEDRAPQRTLQDPN